MPENILKHRKFINFRNREQLIANIMMVVVVVFWGVSFISIKIAVSEIPPTTMAFMRFAIASLFLGAILKRVEPNAKIAKRDIPPMISGGVLGITLYFYFENIGVKLSTAANASLIVTIIPIIAISLDVLVFHSKITALKVVAVIIAVIGTYLSVTANGKIEFNSSNFRGNMFMICAMLSWALYTLVNKSLQGKYSGVVMTTYQTIFGTICLIPLALLEFREWRVFSVTALGHILFLAVCCSVGCYLLYMYVLKHLDIAITTTYLNLVPIVGVVSGHYALQESVFLSQIVGGLLTIFAIIIVNLDQATQRRKTSRENCSNC
jgi:drug/metabolite transporter (DMT)-like permease